MIFRRVTVLCKKTIGIFQASKGMNSHNKLLPVIFCFLPINCLSRSIENLNKKRLFSSISIYF